MRIPLDLLLQGRVYGQVVDVVLLYFEECPNWRDTAGHLATLAAEFPNLKVSRQLVTTVEDAERFRFRGSPSVLVDGVDPFADPASPVGLSCRLYTTPTGPAGSPTLEQLRAVLARV